MSKILKAVRKSARENEDLGARLNQVDSIRLFPLPDGDQLPEFEHLVNSLIKMHDGGDGIVIVFSSASKEEGTSFVSYNVAKQLTVLMDRKVAWVDGNFLRPQDGIQNESYNFRNLLQDPTLWDSFPVADNLTLIPNGSRRIKPTDLLKSDKYDEVLQGFRDRFFFTIIDAPPFLESVDVAHLASKSFGLVVVVESRGLKREIIRNGMENLASHQVDILGAVLNKRVFDIPKAIYKWL